jgi:hypothetical protein
MTSPEQTLYAMLEGHRPTAPTEGSVVEKEMTRGDPDAGVPVTIRNLFTHHDSHPVVLDFALLRSFGMGWMDWEPETVWSEIQKTFQSQISELARAKVQAVKTMHVSPAPWESWQVFEKVIQALNNNIPRWDLMQAPALEQLYAGVDIMDTIQRNPFSDEVKLYMAAAVLHENVLFVPPPLDFIQVEVSQPHYVCIDCGNHEAALFHDGVCDTCTQKWADGMMSGRPDPDLLAQGRGRNVKTILRYDPDSTEELWRKVNDKSLAAAESEVPETADGTQVARLLVARDYMNIRRRQMADQLTALKTWLGAA